MIKGLAVVLLLAFFPSPGAAEEEPEPIDAWSEPVQVLTERMLGTASRAVRFDWRRSTFGVGLSATDVVERNLFDSTRLGITGRMPLPSLFGGSMGELFLSRVFTSSSAGSDDLSKTPYRQPGRPDRFEVAFNLLVPLAEGVVTLRPASLSSVEMVFSGVLGVQYSIYPDLYAFDSIGGFTGALFSARLSDRDLRLLDDLRLPGMRIDRAKILPMVGFALDAYWANGLYLSPRVLMVPPGMKAIGLSSLGVVWELTMTVGWMR